MKDHTACDRERSTVAPTRIPAVPPSEAGVLVKPAYRYAKRRFGEVPEPFAVLAHHPKLMFAAALHETATEKAATKLPVNIRESAVYRTAWTVGCSWCVDFGAMLSRMEGLDVERLKDIADYATSPAYSDDERAAVAYADAMTATPTEVTDEQVADLERRFGRTGVLELTYEIALENQRARMNSALGITDQGFSTGACRVPWAQDRPETGPEPVTK
jgi:AhpD family alkylhydroperoxidase